MERPSLHLRNRVSLCARLFATLQYNASWLRRDTEISLRGNDRSRRELMLHAINVVLNRITYTWTWSDWMFCFYNSNWYLYRVTWLIGDKESSIDIDLCIPGSFIVTARYAKVHYAAPRIFPPYETDLNAWFMISGVASRTCSWRASPFSWHFAKLGEITSPVFLAFNYRTWCVVVNSRKFIAGALRIFQRFSDCTQPRKCCQVTLSVACNLTGICANVNFLEKIPFSLLFIHYTFEGVNSRGVSR